MSYDLPALPLSEGEVFQMWDNPPTPTIATTDGRRWTAVCGVYLRRDPGPDEAPIILDIEIPRPEDITVDLRPALEKVGIDIQFRITGEYGGTSIAVVDFGDRSVIGDEFKIVVLERKQNDGSTARVIAITQTDILGRVNLVGHFDTTSRGETAEAYMSIGGMVQPERMSTERGDEMPPEARAVLNEQWGEYGALVAVYVEPEYRSRGYGKLLWVLALAIHELQGIERLQIRSDITKDKKFPGQSFYEHLGARPVLFMDSDESSHEGGSGITGEWKKRAPTTLADSWVEYLRKVFFHEDLDIVVEE